MTKAKQAGTRFETEVVNFLRTWWEAIDRRPQAGRFDKGDLKYGPAGWTIECKNQAKILLPLFMRQARVEATNNGDERYVVIIKARRGKYSTGATRESYALMPLHMWADVAKEVETLRGRLGRAAA